MSQALPPNLINFSIADLNSAFNQGLDFTSPYSLRKFWRSTFSLILQGISAKHLQVYAASSTFIDDSIAVRSRNLFWRLLNSPQKANEIDHFQLAALWQRCQNVEPFVPIQLPERFLRHPPVSFLVIALYRASSLTLSGPVIREQRF